MKTAGKHVLLHYGCHSISLCSPSFPPDSGKLCVYPEEPVIPSGCRDFPKPAGGLRGAGWSVMWHWWKGCRKFWMLGKEEEEKEGTWPGESDVTSSHTWAFLEVGFREMDNIRLRPKSHQEHACCPLVVGCTKQRYHSSPSPRKSKSTWNFQLWYVDEPVPYLLHLQWPHLRFSICRFSSPVFLHIGFFTSSLVAVNTLHPQPHPHISSPPPCPHTQLRFSLSILFLNYSTDRLLFFSTSFVVIACSCSERREAGREEGGLSVCMLGGGVLNGHYGHS